MPAALLSLIVPSEFGSHFFAIDIYLRKENVSLALHRLLLPAVRAHAANETMVACL